jgi:hypothetical protein
MMYIPGVNKKPVKIIFIPGNSPGPHREIPSQEEKADFW